jgi:hypothetical protein
MVMPSKGVERVLEQVDNTITFLQTVKRRQPGSKKPHTPEYAAGLHDMAIWIKDLLEAEISHQDLRHFLGAAWKLPENPADLENWIKKKNAEAERAAGAGAA